MSEQRRLIVVSNRVPGKKPPAGGLVFALDDCLKRQGGIWIGNSGCTVEEPSRVLTEHECYPYRRLTFETTETEHKQFYSGYSNAVLWPLCHRRTDLMEDQRDSFVGYTQVNRRLARQMSNILKPDDLIWVHDYHFLPLAQELRRLGCGNRMGFFLHIPFPAVNDLRALTENAALFDWLSAFDLLGLQAKRDVAECLAAFRTFGGAELLPNGRLLVKGRHTDVRSFPIGIDAKGFIEAAENPDTMEHIRPTKGHNLVIGVDRLDYSKGLDTRFRAFGQFLDRRGSDAARTTLLQIAPESRSEVQAYKLIRDELERTSGAVNGEHGELDWTPIQYIRRAYPRDLLAGLYRHADVALVTPTIDGMNLVAKEFVAAQDSDDPGVLILSHLAGAAEQLTAALLVNPFDTNEIADAIAKALAMPREERKARHSVLLKNVKDKDLFWWTETYLAVLEDELDSPFGVPKSSISPARFAAQ